MAGELTEAELIALSALARVAVVRIEEMNLSYAAARATITADGQPLPPGYTFHADEEPEVIALQAEMKKRGIFSP